MAKSEIGNLLLLGGVAVGGYFLYNYLTSTPAVISTGTPATGGTGTPGTMTTTTTPPITTTTTSPVTTTTTPLPNTTGGSGSTADAVYAALKAAVVGDTFFTGSGDSLTSTPDHWNFYLKRVVPGATMATPLEPGPNLDTIFTGDARTAPITAAAYWAGVVPWVKSTYGLSGLGMYGAMGLGALEVWRRRR